MYLIYWVFIQDLKILHGFDEYLDISKHSAVDKHFKISSFPLRVPLRTIDGYHLFDEGALPSLLSTCMAWATKDIHPENMASSQSHITPPNSEYHTGS